MYRIACVESNFGRKNNDYHGGIWQVDETMFKDTKDVASHDKLPKKFDKIQKATGITWKDVTWEDLQKPIYSGIAARLFLLNDPTVIPTTVRGQAGYWKTYYKKGRGNEEDFINKCS